LAVGLLPEAQALSAGKRDRAAEVGIILPRQRCSVRYKATTAARDRSRAVVVVVVAQQRQAEALWLALALGMAVTVAPL
jgi:hypothetical protein